MDKPAPSFVYKVKQKPKVIKSSEVKPLFQFTRKRKEYEESIRCDVMDSKFFVDCEAVSNLAGTIEKGANVSNGNVVRRKEAQKQKMSNRKIKDLMGDVTAKGDRKTKRSVGMRKRAAKGSGLERDDKQEEENNRNNERELQTKMLIAKEKAAVVSQMDRGVSRDHNNLLIKDMERMNAAEEYHKPVVKKELFDKWTDMNSFKAPDMPMINKLDNDVSVQHGVITSDRAINDAVSRDKNGIPDQKGCGFIASSTHVGMKNNINVNRISPLKYFLLLNDNDSEENRINQIIRMSLDYLSEQESSFKNLDLRIELKDKVQDKIREVECEIERCKSEIEKWEGMGQEYVANCLKEGIRLKEKNTTLKHEENDKNDNAILVEQNKERIAKLALMMNKYIEACKNGCEEIYRKMFAMVKGSDLDPLLVLKTLAKLKRMDD